MMAIRIAATVSWVFVFVAPLLFASERELRGLRQCAPLIVWVVFGGLILASMWVAR